MDYNNMSVEGLKTLRATIPPFAEKQINVILL